ncbi:MULTISPECIES: hypothetical protein [Streptomyces]|uniref:Uncharacterized protein n=1 Tax=Streptomyces flavovirens TaxID=52258 RepID=A0ABV8NAV2_9ACTN|nr:hypothetical protein [Streptomyces sp. MBT51]MBK3597049.1 hypothetical protein [Streptomyces sp. MBT51]
MTQIFGAIGFTGAAVIMTAILILGARGDWKIKLSNEGVIACAFITGQLYAQAGETFAFVADMSGGLSDAIRGSFGSSGNIGAGAVALLVCLLIYGLEPSKFRNAALALMLPSLFTAAGGLFATFTNLISNITGTVVA